MALKGPEKDIVVNSDLSRTLSWCLGGNQLVLHEPSPMCYSAQSHKDGNTAGFTASDHEICLRKGRTRREDASNYSRYVSPHISWSLRTRSSSTSTFIPLCFFDFFRSSFVTNLPGVMGVMGV